MNMSQNKKFAFLKMECKKRDSLYLLFKEKGNLSLKYLPFNSELVKEMLFKINKFGDKKVADFICHTRVSNCKQ